MSKTILSNLADGRESYDSVSTGSLIPFFNRNVSRYPLEAGGPCFDMIPIETQKDQMINVARMHAQQEYDRIMELVRVLHNQASQIKRRLEITDAVHAAKYQFQVYHGQTYWLVFDTRKQENLLVRHGPNGWSSGPPEDYQYIAGVKWLGDHTWIEVENDGS